MTFLPSQTISQSFSHLYTQGKVTQQSATEALETFAKAKGNIEISDVALGPAVLESMPPKGTLTYRVTGHPPAIAQAEAGLEELAKTFL